MQTRLVYVGTSSLLEIERERETGTKNFLVRRHLGVDSKKAISLYMLNCINNHKYTIGHTTYESYDVL